MSPVSAACPSCGAPIEFRYDDTFVRVCQYCNAAVGRGDRGLESLGKMADLARTESPLALYASGKIDGFGYTLTGRAQIEHPAGGGWQEWYARFDDGRWGWLAEAQGRFQLSFHSPVGPLPAWHTLRPGMTLELPTPTGPRRFTVGERSEASYRAAAGELPYRLVPGAGFRYADLDDGAGGVATIDYGAADEPPVLYLGHGYTLAELDLDAGAAPPERPGAADKVSGRHVACPQCKGSLELRAPDVTLRVACPYCGALLDAAQGALRYLLTLDERDRVAPELPLGSTADVEGHTLTLIGAIRRAAEVDGVDYPFTEYLLYHPMTGYRWLVESSGHWSYVTPLPAGAVKDGGRNRASHAGLSFRHFQSCRGRVVAVFGELYWKATPGDAVEMTDYVSPPFVLSREDDASEVNWSLGHYLTAADVARLVRPPAGRAIGRLPPTHGVAPNQPHLHRGLAFLALVLVTALFGAAIVAGVARRPSEIPLTWGDGASAPATPDGDAPGVIRFSEPFALEGGKNVEIELASPVDNGWTYVELDLVNQDSGEVTSVDVPIEYYHGVDGGERWSEGSTRETRVLSPVPAGTYVLRTDQQFVGATPPDLSVKLRQDVFRALYLGVAFLLLLVIPVLALLHRFLFEKRRWAESDHPWSSE